MFTPWKLFNKANSHLRPRQYGPPYNHNPSSSKMPAASFSNLPIRPLPHKFKGGWVGIILLLQWVATLSTSWKWLIPTTVISHFYNTKHCLFQIPPPSLLSGLRGKPFISWSLCSLGNMLFRCDLFAIKTPVPAFQHLFRTGTRPEGKRYSPTSRTPQSTNQTKTKENTRQSARKNLHTVKHTVLRTESSMKIVNTLRRRLKTPMQTNADVQDHALPSTS